MAAIPDVAMILALLGTRLSSVGMTLSAPWSNLLPRRDDKCLSTNQQRGQKTHTGQFPVEVRFGWFMVPPGIVPSHSEILEP